MNIALIAHDGKKPEMVAFVMQHMDFFKKKDVKLFATGTTGSHIEKAGLNVTKVKSGPLGGDAEIAAFVSNKQMDMVLFFRDPLGKHPHEPDVQMLLRLCDVHDVPLATNNASAELIIRGLK